MSKTKEEADRMRRFEERIAKAKEKEADEEKRCTEVLRTEYLKRTGRTEMKP